MWLNVILWHYCLLAHRLETWESSQTHTFNQKLVQPSKETKELVNNKIISQMSRTEFHPHRMLHTNWAAYAQTWKYSEIFKICQPIDKQAPECYSLCSRCDTTTQPSLLFAGSPGSDLCFNLFLYSHLLLWESKLNMAWRWHVGVDSPMCAVCPAPLFLCLVDLNVRDEEGVYIKAFHLQPETCQLNSLPNKAQ